MGTMPAFLQELIDDMNEMPYHADSIIFVPDSSPKQRHGSYSLNLTPANAAGSISWRSTLE